MSSLQYGKLRLFCLMFILGLTVLKIGQALRLALEQGMHTSMQTQGLDENFVQRSRKVWWTVYVLDRQMSSLMGVPLAVRDEDINASLPTFSGSAQKASAMELHVKLSRVLSQILNSMAIYLPSLYSAHLADQFPTIKLSTECMAD